MTTPNIQTDNVKEKVMSPPPHYIHISTIYFNLLSELSHLNKNYFLHMKVFVYVIIKTNNIQIKY